MLSTTFFSLLAAISWGAGDFSGGVASKRANAFMVVIIAHISSLILLIATAVITREHFPSITTWYWGGAAGLGGGFGLMLLYTALADGRMSVAAPVSALIAASVPVIFTIFQQGPPSLIVLTGFILAMVAIWLVSSGAGWKIFPSELLTPVMAGFAFGFFFICLHQAGKESVIFSLIAVRVVSITSLLTFVLITGRPTLPDRNSLGPIFMSGLLDTIGNGAYAIACQAGRLDIAVVLSSLYPASTVLLAWILLKEKITPRQLIGISAILISIILITN